MQFNLLKLETEANHSLKASLNLIVASQWLRTEIINER